MFFSQRKTSVWSETWFSSVWVWPTPVPYFDVVTLRILLFCVLFWLPSQEPTATTTELLLSRPWGTLRSFCVSYEWSRSHKRAPFVLSLLSPSYLLTSWWPPLKLNPLVRKGILGSELEVDYLSSWSHSSYRHKAHPLFLLPNWFFFHFKYFSCVCSAICTLSNTCTNISMQMFELI